MGWAVCDAAQEPAHVPGLSETLHGDGKDPPLHRYKASLRVKWSSLLSTAGITCRRRSKTRGKFSPWIVDSHRTDPPRVCAGVRAGEGSGAPQPLCSNLSPSHGSFPPPNRHHQTLPGGPCHPSRLRLLPQAGTRRPHLPHRDAHPKDARTGDSWGILVLFPKHQSHCPGPSVPEFSKRCPQRTLSTGAASAAPNDPWPWGDQVLPVSSARQETGSRLSLGLGSGGPRAREPGAGVQGT